MPRPFLIIDGYNLLHAAGLARPSYGPGGLERRRNRLLAHLRRHLGAQERERTTVVFDAADAPADAPRRTTLDGMTVMFARRGGDADSEIEALIAAHSAPRQVRVVSSDHRLQKAARRRRGTAVDSDVFLAELDERGPVSDDPPPHRGGGRHAGPKYGGATSAAETQHWLAVFGEGVAAASPGGTADQTAATPAGADPETTARSAAPGSDEVAFWQARVDELLDGGASNGT